MLILRRGMRNPCAPTFVPHFFPPGPTQAVEFSIAVPLASASKAAPGFAPARCPRGPVERRSGEAQRAQLPSRTGCLCTPSRLIFRLKFANSARTRGPTNQEQIIRSKPRNRESRLPLKSCETMVNRMDLAIPFARFFSIILYPRLKNNMYLIFSFVWYFHKKMHSGVPHARVNVKDPFSTPGCHDQSRVSA